MRFDTLAIHAGQTPDPTTGAIMTPVYFTSTYVQDGPGEHKGYVYARGHNLTRHALEQNLAFVTAFADTVLVLGKGRVRWQGTPDQLGAAHEVKGRWLGV